jgi:hypothetical protein
MSEAEIPPSQREFCCIHCNGRLFIPRDLPPTTAPCPHCGGVITSPAPELPAAPPPQAEHPTTPSPAPVAVVESPATPLVPPAEESEPIHLPQLEPLPKVALREQTAKPERRRLIPRLLFFLLQVSAAGAIAYFAKEEIMKNKASTPPPFKATVRDPAAKEANYIRIGWQKEARQVLEGFVAATDSQGKLPFVLHAENLREKLENFYRGGVILDSDTPAEAFSVYELSEEDRKRGLFMMIYDQPPQFEMSEFFRPLASLEVQYGVDPADLLLSTLALVENFAMEPLRVQAFFKRTSEGLKLDWEVFVQTKYRSFQDFVELPEPGQTRVFRVFIVEDVPEKGRAVAGTRTYRLVDPAHTDDSARVNVLVDSEIGRTLSEINWRGAIDRQPITRTATVELKWSGQANAPELELSRFICWEFLGLGGQELTTSVSAN